MTEQPARGLPSGVAIHPDRVQTRAKENIGSNKKITMSAVALVILGVVAKNCMPVCRSWYVWRVAVVWRIVSY